MLLDKNILPNIIAIALVIIGWLLPAPVGTVVFYTGLFAFSGAITNWLAVHMLFEKVPGLYGSGVIPTRFEEIKVGIHSLVTKEVFNKANIEKFFDNSKNATRGIDIEPVVNNLDMDDAYDQLVAVVMESSLGSMLAMVGGASTLDTMREPFKVRMREFLLKTVRSPSFQKNLQNQLQSITGSDDFSERVAAVVKGRLDEMTPELVKDIMQRMIRKHLGWLVVWGAVIGGLIGFVSSLFMIK